jgi:hypothetical protein
MDDLTDTEMKPHGLGEMRNDNESKKKKLDGKTVSKMDKRRTEETGSCTRRNRVVQEKRGQNQPAATKKTLEKK